jgi:hypothetical protein
VGIGTNRSPGTGSRRPVADTLAWLERETAFARLASWKAANRRSSSGTIDLLLARAGQAHPTRQGYEEMTKTRQVARLLEAGGEA